MNKKKLAHFLKAAICRLLGCLLCTHSPLTFCKGWAHSVEICAMS